MDLESLVADARQRRPQPMSPRERLYAGVSAIAFLGVIGLLGATPPHDAPPRPAPPPAGRAARPCRPAPAGASVRARHALPVRGQQRVRGPHADRPRPNPL